MKVLLDGFWWVEGPHSNQLVLHELIRGWMDAYPRDNLVVAAPARQGVRRTKSLPVGNIREVATHLRLHPLINGFELPVIAKRLGVDAVLAQNFGVPYRASGVYIYDVIFQSHPEWFTRSERVYLSFIPRLASRAGVIFTETWAERRRIVQHNGENRRVIPTKLGLPTDLLTCTPRRPAIPLIADQFVLTVGRLNARKNLAMLVDGAIRSGVVTAACPLVIVGDASGRRLSSRSVISEAVGQGLAIIAETMETQELSWLYRNCRLFVYLSLAEGFGLPPVEAAALGSRVVVSNLEVFRETLGDRAVYTDPTDVEAIARSIKAVSGTEDISGRLGPSVADSWRDVVDVIRHGLADEIRANEAP